MRVAAPDGVCGAWRVDTFTINKEQSEISALRAVWQCDRDLYVPPGTYKRLTHNGQIVMSNTPMEVRTNQPILRHGQGDVLINGLGLGMVVTALLGDPLVRHITVVEIEDAVLTLVGPTFAGNPRVTLIHADATTYSPPAGARYDAVWHDIWPTLSESNQPAMTRLKRRYGHRTAWQGCWGEDLLRERRAHVERTATRLRQLMHDIERSPRLQAHLHGGRDERRQYP